MGQPIKKPAERREVPQAEYFMLATGRFGKFPRWVFVCPQCGTKQTPTDVEAAGGNPTTQAGFSCIGRFRKDVGCDWTLGGLFQIHTVTVVNDDGTKFPFFELAEAGETSDVDQAKGGAAVVP